MERQTLGNKYAIPISIVLAGMMITAGTYSSKTVSSGENSAASNKTAATQDIQASVTEEAVSPSGGVILPVVWGDLGARLVNSGTIDAGKFKAIYESGGRFNNEYQELLFGQNDGRLKITKENAGYILNLFWALGLANSNAILDSGEMTNSTYGGAQNFASTGGWTVAKGSPMNHYSQHVFFNLTSGQQALVEKVSKNIYRPCCNNPTYFPDCNHGMAMLGFLELMASQGVSEQDMYKAALVVNSYWFPDTYIIIAKYMKMKDIDWNDVRPIEILSANYSSGSGFAKISAQVSQPVQKEGDRCGVDTQQPIAQPKQQSGCGV